MSYKLFNYQDQAVEEILENSIELINNRNKENKYILLEAITGAGKTVMASSFIDRLVLNKENICFVWITKGDGSLEKQTYDRLKRDLSNNIKLINKDEILTKDELYHGDLVVLNWESLNNRDKKTGEFTNILMRDGEKRNLIEILDSTKDKGVSIVCFIDEAHANSDSETSKEIIGLINPLFTIKITATPDKKQLGEDLINKKAIHIQINPEDVIEEGVIKKEILINSSLSSDSEVSDIELLLENALTMQSKLYEAYEKRVNPLILIQIPNGKQGKETREAVEAYLSNKEGFDMSKEYAVKLSNESDDNKLDGIDALNNPVKCLLFKQSVSTGWDCPRAQILVKLRESKSETFDLQVIGRILRMPELSRRKHYDNDILNNAYIYTNIDEFKIEAGSYSKNVLPIRTVAREEFEDDEIELPSSRLRKKYLKFEAGLFDSKFSFNLMKNYNVSDLYNTHDISREYSVSQIDSKDITLLNQNIENNKDVFKVNLSIDGIEKEYNSFVDKIDNKNRNHIKNSIKSIFFKNLKLDMSKDSIINIQKSVLNNREIFKNIINQTLDELKVELDYIEDIYTYKPLKELYYSKDLDLTDKYNKSFYKLVSVSSHKTEILFEDILDKNPEVKYWIKNKDKGSDALGISYKHENKLHVFYPDYIVKFNNGEIGIYEVKSISDRDAETITKDKETSLLKYTINNKNIVADAQIVKVDSSRKTFLPESLGRLK